MWPNKPNWLRVPREVVRGFPCGRCGAPQHQPCTDDDGTPREANHKERAMLVTSPSVKGLQQAFDRVEEVKAAKRAVATPAGQYVVRAEATRAPTKPDAPTSEERERVRVQVRTVPCPKCNAPARVRCRSWRDGAQRQLVAHHVERFHAWQLVGQTADLFPTQPIERHGVSTVEKTTTPSQKGI